MRRRPGLGYWPAVVVAGLAVMCALAACSKPAPKPRIAATTVPTPPVAGVSAAPSTPATMSGHGATTPPVSIPPTACGAQHIKVSAAGPNSGAAGTIVQRFVLTNTGSRTCTMSKYPFVSAYGLVQQGSTKVEATLDVSVGPIPANFGQLGAVGGRQTLPHNGTAVFFLKWSQVPTGSETSCPQADGFDFRPPTDPSTSDQELVPYSFTPCDIQVSQVFSASTGS